MFSAFSSVFSIALSLYQRLFLVKVSTARAVLCGLCALLFFAHPAQAQWQIVDQNGQTITSSGDGTYSLKGTMTGTATNSYPADGTAQAINGTYIASLPYSPNPLSAFGYLCPNSPMVPPTSLQPSIGLSATASNNFYWATLFYGYWRIYGSDWTLPSSIEPLVGASTVNVASLFSAQYRYIPTQSAPIAPDHIDLLLNTSLSANTGVNYNSSGQTAGLSASASASDSLAEQVTSSATVPGSGTPSNYVGHHLLRVPVTNGTALVTLGETVGLNATDNLEWGQIYYDGDSGYYQDG